MQCKHRRATDGGDQQLLHDSVVTQLLLSYLDEVTLQGTRRGIGDLIDEASDGLPIRHDLDYFDVNLVSESQHLRLRGNLCCKLGHSEECRCCLCYICTAGIFSRTVHIQL